MLAPKAETTWAALNGIICVYKPLELSMDLVRKTIRKNLCKDLNSLETRPPRSYIDIKQTGSKVSVDVRPSYADNVLSVGPRYQTWDIEVKFASVIGERTSGVFVLGLNEGTHLIRAIKKCSFTKCYHVKGILGMATENFHIDGKVVGKAKCHKINEYVFEKILASYQSANQRRMFMESGISLQSEEAYDLAVSGLYRPIEKGNPIVYSLKIVEFKNPNFTLEVQCINETEEYLLNLIHNLGVSLKSLATCTGIRCIRFGCFHVEHSLLRKHWTLTNVINNMKLCFGTLKKNFPDSLKHIPTVDSHEVATAKN